MINRELLIKRFENIQKSHPNNKKVADECQNSINVFQTLEDKYIMMNLESVSSCASSTIMRRETKDILNNIQNFQIEEGLKMELYNEDWQKENEYFDSLKKSPSCSGSYCQNCDYCSTCQNKPANWYL
jgi:hypothetical protein